MDRLVGRDLPLDGIQELDELLVAVALPVLADHRAVEHVEGGEESGGAVALVVVRHRRKRPRFIGRPGEKAASATLRIDTQELGEPATFLKLFELRAVLEIAAAEMAATRRTEDDLREIEALLERLRQADEWRAEGVDVDLDMHRAIARASHNDYIAVFVSFLSEHMRRSIMAARQRYALAAIVEVTIAEHAAIVDAVRARDAEAAGHSMRDHIVNAAARIGLPRLEVPRPDASAPTATEFAAVTRN